MKVAGVIDSITSKTVSNGGTVYTAHIDGQEINLGFQCNHSEGEYVELEVESTKWGLQVPRTFGGRKTGGTNSAAPARKTSTPRQASPAKVFPVDPNSKDHSIIRQNALTNANTMVANACENSEEDMFKTREDYYNEVIKAAYNLAGFAMGTLDRELAKQLSAHAPDEADDQE
jgi:hypothetical protein